MKQNYEIQGMSCGGCVSSVKKVLLQLPGVEDAEVHLHPQTAVLTMSNPIDVSELQTQLSKAGHYTIKEVVFK
jgi:copper chaperone CopZ